MNSLERILSAVAGKPADFQPFTMLLSLYGAGLAEARTIDYYQNADIWFSGQQAVIDAFDPDIVISPFSFPTQASAFGSELVYLDKYAPNIRKPIISRLEQLGSLSLPDIESTPPLQFLLKGTRLLAQQYRGEKAIACPIYSPADLPSAFMGIEMWIDTLLFHPQEVASLMEKTVEHFVSLGNEFLASGATFLVVPVNFTNPMIITEKIFAQLLPYLERAFAQIKGPIVVHNGGCKIMPFISRFAALPNVAALVLEPSESFEEARKAVGAEMVLMGNFDGPHLAQMTVKQATESALKILENRKNDPHFIFATSNADIPYHTPMETIQAVADTIRAFKKY